MKRGFPMVTMIRAARRLGRRDYDAAIRLIEEHLAGDPLDTAILSLLADCHRQAGHDDKAIEVAERILRIDSRDFGALKLLSEILAGRGEHERAVPYVRRGLEQFPADMNPIPRGLARAGGWLLRTLRPRRRISPAEFDPTIRINRENREWFEWARKYLAWFDAGTGGNTSPVIH